MDNIKISVCIPTTELRNLQSESEGVYMLNFLLESISRQTYKNIEIIIADQSGYSDIENLCKTWSSLPIFYYKNNTSIKTAAGNLNYAYSKATGEYIKPVFQDDFFQEANALETIANNVNGHGWGAVGTYHCNENDYQNLVRPHIPRWQDPKLILAGGNTLSGPTAIFHKNDISNLLDTNLEYMNDCEFYYRLFEKYGEPLLINNLLMNTRIRASGLSSTISKELIKDEKQYCMDKHINKIPIDISNYYNIKNKIKR